MAYRKTEVNGKEYQYTIGKDFVKIRGMQAVPKSKVGQVDHYDDWGRAVYKVTPALVQIYIQNNVK
jgi:hypothetical protein